jgi:alcohol dehydrogenase
LRHLRREEEELRPPDAGAVQVRVGAIGLNLADVFACLGLYSATPPVPFVPGLEFAGVVEAVNAGSPAGRLTPSFRPGDRVIGLTRFGAYATRVNTDARYLRALPPSWSFAEGAAFPVQAITAWYALHELGRVRQDDVVLLHSAAGGVGLNALRLLRGRRHVVVATVGREEKRRLLVEREGLDVAQVIVRDPRRFDAQLDAALSTLDAGGVDVVLDGIAGPYFQPAFKRLRPEGRYVLFGASDLMPAGATRNYLTLAPRYLRRPRIDPLRMISRNRSVLAFNLIWLWDRSERLGNLYDEVSSVLVDPPMVGRTYPFARAPEALEWLKSGQSVGKVVLELEKQS